MTVATTIYSNLDVTMLGFMRDNAEVGYYDVAVKIKVILVNVVTSLGAVLLPRTSYYVEMKMDKEFRAAVSYTHLDVYKRQQCDTAVRSHKNTS